MNDYVGVVRNEEGLRDTIAEFERMENEDLPNIAIAEENPIGNYDWVEALEVTSMVQLAKAMAGAALMRTESRGAHFREDYPALDDKNWLRNIHIYQKENDPSLTFDARARKKAPEYEMAQKGSN